MVTTWKPSDLFKARQLVEGLIQWRFTTFFIEFVPIFSFLFLFCKENLLKKTQLIFSQSSSDFLSQNFDREFVCVNVPCPLFVRIVDLFSFESQTQDVWVRRVRVQKWGMEPGKAENGNGINGQ